MNSTCEKVSQLLRDERKRVRIGEQLLLEEGAKNNGQQQQRDGGGSIMGLDIETQLQHSSVRAATMVAVLAYPS